MTIPFEFVTDTFFASCPFGLESVLMEELTELNANDLKRSRKGVEFKCSNLQALKIAFNSRISSRINKKLFSFDIIDGEDLYRQCMQIDWTKILNLENTFKINSILINLKGDDPKFKNSMYLSLKIKDAVADRFRQAFNQRPNIAKDNPDVELIATLYKNKETDNYHLTVSIDLLGFHLSQRGYRMSRNEAPLKENLAAGLIRLANWDPENEVLWDPMCGSGTIALEAVLIEKNIPPSYLKILNRKNHRFSYQCSPLFSECWPAMESYLEDEANRIKNLLNTRADFKVWASDRDQVAIDHVTNNAKRGRIEKRFRIFQNDFNIKGRHLKQPTLIIMNPPYGKRMSFGNDLEHFYFQLSERLKQNYSEHRAFILSGDEQLRQAMTIKAASKKDVHNGNIECKFLDYTVKQRDEYGEVNGNC
jgi:23S rRNA G2445 N2-methylase RlmL